MDLKMDRNKLDASLGARQVKIFSYNTEGLCWGICKIVRGKGHGFTVHIFSFKILILIVRVICKFICINTSTCIYKYIHKCIHESRTVELLCWLRGARDQ